jgi:threonine dehydrogenase-like Zn-dependent dehydrogenase
VDKPQARCVWPPTKGICSDREILETTDVIVRVDSSTICGTDLHILKGDVPEAGGLSR